MSTLLIKNIAALVTCDSQDNVYQNVHVLCKDGVIEAIRTEPCSADETLDATNMWMYPGLINTHHHLYQYFTRNLPMVQNMELFDWLKTLYALWEHLDEDTVRYSSLAGMGELMRYGCTTCLDHHYVFPANAPATLIDTQFEAAAALNMRFHATRGSMSLSEKDGGLPPDSVVQPIDTILRDSRRLIETYHDQRPFSMRQVALAPCSPFSVTGDLLRESAKLARSYHVRLHTHLCETKDEERFTQQAHGMRPYAYMESLGWTGADVWYAHGIHFDDAELARMAEAGVGVAHCPSSNMKLSSGVCRVPDMRLRGIPVGLAVDGSASNDHSNMLQELRTAYLLHRLQYGKQAPTGYDLLKMATNGSARLLGREKSLGQITPGYAADMFLLETKRLDMLGTHLDPKSFLGTVGYSGPVAYTIINGQITVAAGRLTQVDEDALLQKGRRAVDRLLSNL